MRVLVAGAGGMLGTDTVEALVARRHEVFALARADLDVTDSAQVEAVIDEIRPAAVVNCAAYTNVDGAESDEAAAMAVNDTGAALLASSAAEIGAKVLYVSSDYVFDGASDAPYVESDVTGPISAYGRSKQAGETSVAITNPRHLIVRSSWLFGVNGPNFVETMLRLADEQSEVIVVTDQVGCPTYTRHLGQALAILVDSDDYGIHHVAASDSCSWYEFAQEIFDQEGVECRVMAGTTEMLARPAPRPAWSVLGQRAPRRRRPAALATRPRRVPRRAPRDRGGPRDRSGGLATVILVTGGAGFIGSAYVRRRLELASRRARPRPRQAHLRRPAREPRGPRRGRARRGRHRRPRGRRAGARGVRGDRQLRRRDPRRPLDRGPRGVHRDRRLRDLRPAGGRPRRRHPPSPGLDRRGLRIDRGGLVHRGLAARPVVALLGLEGRRRPARRRLRAHLRRRRADRPRLEQLRAAAVPGEADPALHPQRARRRPAARLRGRDAGSQLALGRRLRERDRRRARARRARARSTTSADPTSSRTSTSSGGSSSSRAATSR